MGERDTERDHWRRNKIRICSVDSEDEVEERVLSSKGRVFRRTRTECEYIICFIFMRTNASEKA